MITIVGCNKGGATKTTTATGIATGLAIRGHDVCLVDADPQRTAAKWFAERETQDVTTKFTLIEKRDNIASTLRNLNEKFDHVIVDVAGRNSRELITGATVADLIIAPHQCSQFDLDTLAELQEQVIKIRDLNPTLRVQVYQSMASTNVKVKDRERAEFLEYLDEFPEFEVLKAIGYYRKIYKDAASEGRSVLEVGDNPGADEIRALLNEVYGHA
jgi:chromosome partitioning protein